MPSAYVPRHLRSRTTVGRCASGSGFFAAGALQREDHGTPLRAILQSSARTACSFREVGLEKADSTTSGEESFILEKACKTAGFGKSQENGLRPPPRQIRVVARACNVTNLLAIPFSRPLAATARLREGNIDSDCSYEMALRSQETTVVEVHKADRPASDGLYAPRCKHGRCQGRFGFEEFLQIKSIQL